MINKVILIGNIGKDPDVRRLESGATVAKFSIATNENYLDKTTNEWQTVTEWHTVIAWRHLAERAEKYCRKGKLIYIEGKLTTRKWQDKEGNDRYTTEVVAKDLKMLEKRDGGPGMPSEEPAGTVPAITVPATDKKGAGWDQEHLQDLPRDGDAPADDLPF